MDFYICFDPSKISLFEINYCSNLQINKKKSNVLYIEKLNHLDYVEQQSGEFIQLAVGDVILNDLGRITLNDTRGIFYSFMFGTDHKFLEISPDNFSLLPIYYMNQDGCYHISSSFYLLSKLAKNKTINQNFHLEVALFYTQINGSTFLTTFNRLEFGQSIVLNDEFKVKQNKRFYDYFVDKPSPYKASLERMADSFIEISKYYLNEPSAISLTGGFDGRTITACAHYHKADFINFSYGRKGNGDVDNPTFIANKLGLNYKLIELGPAYLNSDYLKCVESYVKYSGGLNGFQYPQSVYYVKQLCAESVPIITGYLGSEILSNAKSSDDEINSVSLIDFLKTGRIDDNYAFSFNSILQQLGLVQHSISITEVLNDLGAYFSALPKHLTVNQKLAVFSFENTHRNTFGTWIYSAMHYAKVRVPFLDKEFFLAISNTEVSQFYREFLLNNPIKRLHGQRLYPVILKKTWPEINALTSSKGYAPIDILSTYGRLKIAINRFFIKRNDFSEIHGLDKMSTISGAISYLQRLDAEDRQFYLDKDKFIGLMGGNSIDRALCFLALSKIESIKLLN